MSDLSGTQWSVLQKQANVVPCSIATFAKSPLVDVPWQSEDEQRYCLDAPRQVHVRASGTYENRTRLDR